MEAKELVLTLEWERVIDAFLWAHKICRHSPKPLTGIVQFFESGETSPSHRDGGALAAGVDSS